MAVGDYIPINRFELELKVRAEVEAKVRAQVEAEVMPYLVKVDEYLADIEAIVTVLGERLNALEQPEGEPADDAPSP